MNVFRRKNKMNNLSGNRKNIKDIWNAFMVKNADFTKSKYDIPYCPTTTNANEIPENIITFSEAINIYNKNIKNNKNFFCNAYVCFYEDDQKFDGKNKGIWSNPKGAYDILNHFDGLITPDFSTYQDFPISLKIYNTYRMRAFGYWYGTLCKKKVINNVRWGTRETFNFCFDGIPKNSIIAIGTVGGSPFKLIDRERFENGLLVMMKKLSPKTIIIYGSAKYRCLKELSHNGVKIYEFTSRTSLYFKKQNKEGHK